MPSHHRSWALRKTSTTRTHALDTDHRAEVLAAVTAPLRGLI
ncbi:hypothetical protein I546_1797 [Mycobacterium kansasii 732]|nr:hypothetical protein I546_1797 [Mycobacterium kansasii 732]